MLLIVFVIYFIQLTSASLGDSSPYYQRCTERCLLLNCTEDGQGFVNDAKVQPIHLKLFFWDCKSECKYECMWKATESFENRNWNIQQFHGKWPFVRFFGIQEPASVIFSLANMFIHYYMFKKFKSYIRRGTPLYWVWHLYTAVCINAWIWSSVFHSRDFPFTEFMDYSCAFSILLVNCYCMVQRLLLGMPRMMNILISSCFFAFFVNHVAYIRSGRFDYAYNMKLNVMLGAVTTLFWFSWCVYNKKKQPYVSKLASYVTLNALSIILELFDFPPILWIFDSHSLWHLATAVVIPLFYGFIIDDSRYLRKMVGEKQKSV